jgi:hypothetical protein
MFKPAQIKKAFTKLDESNKNETNVDNNEF